jgi:hypothetical protein
MRLSRLSSLLISGGRPRPALNVTLAVLVAIAAAVYHPLLLPWMMTWGATTEEARMALPGDDLVPQATFQSTRAITIAAPPERIWPWLVQIGQDRGGFYSYDWMENLIGADIHNADRIVPDWQHRVRGDFVPSLRPNYGGGRLRDIAGWRVGWIEANRGLALVGWGAFVLLPIDETHTRLIVRTRTATPPGAFFSRFADLMFGRPLHFVMERRMLLGIQERVEGTASGLPALVPAGLGFLFITLLVSWYLLLKGDALWLFLTLAIAVSLMKGADDPQAALVGVTATSVTTLGLLRLRHWWAVDAAAAALVLLVLLIARDAYVTIGIGLLGVGIATMAGAAMVGIPRDADSPFDVPIRLGRRV